MKMHATMILKLKQMIILVCIMIVFRNVAVVLQRIVLGYVEEMQK